MSILFFFFFFPQTDSPFIIICYFQHKGADRRKYCQRRPKNCPEFHCLFDEWAHSTVCFRITFSLAAVRLCVYMYVCIYLFLFYSLTVFVLSCLSCTLFVDLLVCPGVCLAFPKRIRSHVRGNHFDGRTAPNDPALLLHTADLSHLQYQHLFCQNSIFTVHPVWSCVRKKRQRGEETKAGETPETKALSPLRPLNGIRGCCRLIKEKLSPERGEP